MMQEILLGSMLIIILLREIYMQKWMREQMKVNDGLAKAISSCATEINKIIKVLK